MCPQDGTSDIRAILLDENAKPLGEDFQVNPTDTGWERTPMSTALPDGRFFMAWQSDYDIAWGDPPPIPVEASIMGRFFNADGSPAGDAFRINSTPANRVTTPLNSLQTQSDGTILATWWTFDKENSTDPQHLLGQRIDANGTPIGGEIILEDRTGYPENRSWMTDLTRTRRRADTRDLVLLGRREPRSPRAAPG